MQARSRVLLTLPLTLILGCASQSLGKVPPSVVQLYDEADPAGVIELEIDRDGSLREVEAEVPIESVPDAVREAVARLAPDAEVVGAEREINSAGSMWELQVNSDGRAWEFVIDESGAVYEIEKELTAEEAPAAVLEAAEGAVPGSSFRSVERIERGTTVEYHVKRELDGASYKVVLDSGGRVLRTVREARAEIEIPIAG